MPEGDTVAYAARRIRPVLEGRVPDRILTPQPRHTLDRWPERLSGRQVSRVGTHGKHLFVHFEGGLVLHSHLGMSGSWRVLSRESQWRRAWIAIRAGERWAVEFNGPTLELLTEGRARFDQRLAALGPDVLAEPEFDGTRFLALLRADDPTRPFGDALLDQRTVAGIGNIWKSEGCWEAGVDPGRRIREVADDDALEVLARVRPRMLRSAREGHRAIEPRVYGRHGRPCPRCGEAIAIGRHGDGNRSTYWCPGCQK